MAVNCDPQFPSELLFSGMSLISLPVMALLLTLLHPHCWPRFAFETPIMFFIYNQLFGFLELFCTQVATWLKPSSPLIFVPVLLVNQACPDRFNSHIPPSYATAFMSHLCCAASPCLSIISPNNIPDCLHVYYKHRSLLLSFIPSC